MLRAYEGCDGSGKTELLVELEHHNYIMHLCNISKKYKLNEMHGFLREFILGVERLFCGYFLFVKDKFTWYDNILDRSYISGLVYADFWNNKKYNFFKKIEVKPDEIYLVMPFKYRIRPEQEEYRNKIDWFNKRFYKVITDEGYKRHDKFEYNHGIVIIFKRCEK